MTTEQGDALVNILGLTILLEYPPNAGVRFVDTFRFLLKYIPAPPRCELSYRPNDCRSYHPPFCETNTLSALVEL
jgi:hypothetical protein